MEGDKGSKVAETRLDESDVTQTVDTAEPN